MASNTWQMPPETSSVQEGVTHQHFCIPNIMAAFNTPTYTQKVMHTEDCEKAYQIDGQEEIFKSIQSGIRYRKLDNLGGVYSAWGNSNKGPAGRWLDSRRCLLTRSTCAHRCPRSSSCMITGCTRGHSLGNTCKNTRCTPGLCYSSTCRTCRTPGHCNLRYETCVNMRIAYHYDRDAARSKANM